MKLPAAIPPGLVAYLLGAVSMAFGVTLGVVVRAVT